MSWHIDEIEKFKDLDLKLKLYSIDANIEELKKLITGKETEKIRNFGYYKEGLALTKIQKLVRNKRGTLKLVLLDNGLLGIFNKEIRASSIPHINVPYGKEASLFDYLEEGHYVLVVRDYWSSHIAFVTDTTSKKEAKKFYLELLKINNLREKYRHFRELSEVGSMKHTGKVCLKDLKEYRRKLEEIVRECKQKELEEKRKREKALRENVIISEDGRRVKVKALDEHTYHFLFPERVKKKDFVSLVYKHRYFLNATTMTVLKERTLWEEVRDILTPKLDEGELGIAVDKKKMVKLRRKVFKTKNGEILAIYLNDTRVAKNEVWDILWNYFFQKSKLVTKKKNGKKRRKFLSPEEKRLLEEGINGYLSDLEGTVPINLGVEKKGTRWFLTIGGNRVYIRGGISTIKKIKNVIEGKSRSFDTDHSTEELYKRLCSVLPEKVALDLIVSAKEMGKLLKAIGGNKR